MKNQRDKQQRARVVDANIEGKWHRGVLQPTHGKMKKGILGVCVRGTAWQLPHTHVRFAKHNGRRFRSAKERYNPPAPRGGSRGIIKTVKVTPTAYVHGDRDTDYNHMITRPGDAHNLFVFNDNLEEWVVQSTSRGGGNACVRPYYAQKKAIGVPTGHYGVGFNSLRERCADSATFTVKDVIDAAIDDIAKWLFEHQYDKIYFSSDDGGKMLGAGIFLVGDEVKAYVAQELMKINCKLMQRKYNDKPDGDSSDRAVQVRRDLALQMGLPTP